MRWLSGRVLDSRSRGCGFEPHWRHCVVSFIFCLVLVQPWKIVDWDVKNQIKQTNRPNVYPVYDELVDWNCVISKMDKKFHQSKTSYMEEENVWKWFPAVNHCHADYFYVLHSFPNVFLWTIFTSEGFVVSTFRQTLRLTTLKIYY